MMKYIYILFFVISLNSCDVDIPGAPIPDEQIHNALSGTINMSRKQLEVMEGIFNIDGENAPFGERAVISATDNYISVFCKKNTSFMVLKAGYTANHITLAGYWRYSQSADIGFIRLDIDSAYGAADIIKSIRPKNIKLRGEYNNKSISFAFTDTLVKTDFMIIGHRGGGRNIDRHPASENSLDMIKYCEKLGANAIEIDVRLTKDGVPVLFHDEYLNKRLIREDYFIGKVSDYTFAQLRSFVTLKNGERIPTLREALNTVLDETNIKMVWLDTKAAGLVPTFDSIITEYNEKAAFNNRKLNIYMGIPDEDVYAEYIKYYNHKNIPSICELDEEYVINADSKIWAPRWSLGLLTDRVLAMQEKGKKVFVWTLDEPTFIVKFLGKSYFNGILSNYPAMVAYEYFTF